LIQAFLGIAIGLHLNSENFPRKWMVSFGFVLFLSGIGFALQSGKSIWMPFFWEISSLGTFFSFFQKEQFESSSRLSILLSFLSSGISAVLLLGWIYTPEGDFYSVLFLLLALLLKSSFSVFHLWYPLFHKGSTPSISAGLSSVSSIMPLLIYLQYLHPVIQQPVIFKIFIPIAGAGVFLGGFTAFFNKDIRQSLAYSSIESINFLWLLLFLAGFWKTEILDSPIELQDGFLLLFYITLAHHSISKAYQFFLFGKVISISESSSIDENRGVGRLLQMSTILAGVGTFSYILIPGTLGFTSESTYLYMLSKILEIPGKKTIIVVPALIFILFGQVLGSVAHLRMYLTIFLSIPSKITDRVNNKNNFSYSLLYLACLQFLIPIGISGLFLGNNFLSLPLYKNFGGWFWQILWINLISIIVYYTIYRTQMKPSATNKISWDCGNQYAGPELSIPSSVISDPLHDSLGAMINRDTGESKVDLWLLERIQRVLNIGEIWIEKTESGDLSNYIAFSSISLLVTFFIILFLRFYKDALWKILTS
jgi:formate hydrogenlyase subunit 3/multisubunit Na+/H+ antiporter MnhD subunit